ncbi:hypothetical protein [Streptomyces naganishii]|nr:hypothetical protein [Streptomyces naganishii]
MAHAISNRVPTARSCAAPGSPDDTVRLDATRDPARSCNAVLCYALGPAVSGVPERIPPGRGGEVRLTDAPRGPASDGTVHGAAFDGPRHDTGDKAHHLRTVVRPACDRPGPPIRDRSSCPGHGSS